jgi:demethylmenaquinone methyltransferase/2-methoxy-6-polyprenyl-1,4-benzoquinol methylase
MVKIAREKFAGEARVRIHCADAQIWETDRSFDCILIYNAFPHFSDPKKLLKNLSRFLRPGGRLTVAHGMSRERINAHHQGGASRVSGGLPPAEELSALLAACLTVDRVVSDEAMYLVSGVRNGTNV